MMLPSFFLSRSFYKNSLFRRTDRIAVAILRTIVVQDQSANATILINLWYLCVILDDVFLDFTKNTHISRFFWHHPAMFVLHNYYFLIWNEKQPKFQGKYVHEWHSLNALSNFLSSEIVWLNQCWFECSECSKDSPCHEIHSINSMNLWLMTLSSPL